MEIIRIGGSPASRKRAAGKINQSIASALLLLKWAKAEGNYGFTGVIYGGSIDEGMPVLSGKASVDSQADLRRESSPGGKV